VRGIIVRASVFLLWLTATFWLIRFEAFPEFFTHSLSGYRGILPDSLLLKDSWMRILFNDRPVGYSFTSVEANDKAGSRGYEMKNEVTINLAALSLNSTFELESSAFLDSGYKLQGFQSSITLSPLVLQVKGTRRDAERFDIRIETPQSTRSVISAIPDDAILYNPFSDIAAQRLKPGRKLTLWTFDPVSARKIPVKAEALRHESITLGNQNFDCIVIQSLYMGIMLTSWVDAEGNVVRQTSPLGFTLEKCSAEEAIKAAHPQKGEESPIFPPMVGEYLRQFLAPGADFLPIPSAAPASKENTPERTAP
jgi:hypothetical protein